MHNSLTFYMFSACSALLLLADFVIALFFSRTKRRIESLGSKGQEAKGIIRSHAVNQYRQDIIVYAFATAENRQLYGKQVFPSPLNRAVYPVNSVETVLYLQTSPFINCLKGELESKIKSAKSYGTISVLLPITGCLVIGALWFAFYKMHVI